MCLNYILNTMDSFYKMDFLWGTCMTKINMYILYCDRVIIMHYTDVQYWASARAVLGQCWGSAEAVLDQHQGSAWVSVGSVPGQCWTSSRAVPGRCWGNTGTLLGQCRGTSGPAPGQCWVSVQSALCYMVIFIWLGSHYFFLYKANDKSKKEKPCME